MWSSSLPTGTASSEELGTQTFPDQSTPSGAHQQDQQDQQDQQNGALTNQIEQLRREKQQAETEIGRLETKVDRLEKQSTNRQDSEQAIIDRYEQVISELEQAVATAGDTPKRSVDTRQTTEGNGIIARISRWLSW